MMKNISVKILRDGLLLVLTIALPVLLRAGTDSARTAFELLYEEGLTLKEIVLEFAMEEVKIHRRDEDEFPAIIRFTGPGQREETWNVELNVRGRYRRMVCDFPPLKINFDKDDLRERDLDEHNNLKLVTHCISDWRGEDYLLREYLAYKLYRSLSNTSYRTQLVRIRYVDTATGKSTQRYGFIIEDEKELADRYDSELCEDCYSVPKDSFVQQHLVRLDLFQYMIGNVDWSVKILRNLKMLKPYDGGKYYLIPFDFDFSGFVDPHYVRLPPKLGIRTVRERVYLGFEHDPADFQQALSYFRSNKDSMYQLIDDCQFLSKNSRRYLRSYLNSFFKQMKNDQPAFDQLTADDNR